MNYILFDDSTWDNMRPLTFTKPVAALRIGILTIKEKWERYFKDSFSYKTQDYLQEKYTLDINEDNLLINGSLLPTAELLSEIENLEKGQLLKCGDIICAYRTDKAGVVDFNLNLYVDAESIQTISECKKINHPWDIFSMNGDAIEQDFKLITKGRKSQKLSKTNQVIGDNDIFIEPGAVVECAILNTTKGSIFIGKNAEIMENSAIRGPFALCQGSTVNMGAKIYGPTTVGPFSKVGGEVNNVVIQAYSNKGHDGFLGNSVIGEWCNFGADTNNSNLKNNYTEVKVWNYDKNRFLKTGLQFCGLIMGDHSKCGINTMFNTGTVIGVGANIFGSGFPRNFIPSFAWGGSLGFTSTRLKSVYETASLVMQRRGIEFGETEQKIIETVHNMTASYRENFK